jgi:hypothetical protein
MPISLFLCLLLCTYELTYVAFNVLVLPWLTIETEI